MTSVGIPEINHVTLHLMRINLMFSGVEEVVMTLEEINEVLSEYEPDNFIFQSFSQETRELRIAFTCDGRPKEDQASLVTFGEAVVFHVPSVLCYGRLVFRVAPVSDVDRIIPEISFDEGEFGGDGLKVFLLMDLDGTGHRILYCRRVSSRKLGFADRMR